MSSAPRNPSILALNRFLEPSVFNTGPPIPKVVPTAISPSTTPGSESSAQDTETTRRATGTPDLTSSPSSSNSSLPSTSSAPSRSSSPSSSSPSTTPAPLSNVELLRAFALSRGIQPYGRSPVRIHRVRVPLESDHIKQIFAQPLLSDIMTGGSEAAEANLEMQKDEEALAEKMRLHMNLLSRHAQVDGVDANYTYGYPPYHSDHGAYMHPYAEGYAASGGVVPEGMFYAYYPAHGPFYQSEADGQYAYIPDDYYYGHPQPLPQGAYTYLETDAGFPAQEPSANPNLNPNATPFVPSTTAPAAPSVEPDQPTVPDSEPKCASSTQVSTAPLFPPGLPISPQAQMAV